MSNKPAPALTQQHAIAFAAGALAAGIVGVIARAVLARRDSSQSQAQSQSTSSTAPATRGTLAWQLAALSPLTPTPDAPFTAPPAFHCRHPLPAGVSIRLATLSPEDRRGLASLMRRVASQRGGLAREVDEVTDAYIDGMMEAIDGGVMLLAVAAKGSEAAATAAAALAGGAASAASASSSAAPTIIAVLKASRIGPHRCFRSVLSDCTLAVLPGFQNRKLGQQLFSALFAHLATPGFRHVQRVELIARESNLHALGMYAKVGFNVQAKLCRRILSGMPLHIDSAETSASSSAAVSAFAAPSASAASAAPGAASASSDFSLQFESDIVMVWFNPAFDLEALKDQFRARPTSAAPAAAAAAVVAATVAAAAPATATPTPVAAVAASANARPAIAVKSTAAAAPAPAASSPAAAASSSSAVAPAVAAAAAPAAGPSDDAATSALLASGLRLQSELSQWVRLVAAGDENAPMASAQVVDDYDAMLVLNAGTSGGELDGSAAASAGASEGRVKFFRLRILRCDGFYSCVTHWGLRNSASGSAFASASGSSSGSVAASAAGSGSPSNGAGSASSVSSLGQTSVTSTGSGLDAAEEAFSRKFYQKTGQHWEERRQFKPQEGKYCLVPLRAQQANSKAQQSQPAQSKANAKQKK